MEDITKTGGQGYKALQNQNEEPYRLERIVRKVDPTSPPTPRVRQFIPNQLENWYEGSEQSPIMQQHNGEYWGSSRHDIATATQDEWEAMQQNPYEFRAQNQGALSKWGAGLAKGVGLAATTFLDGTVGLIYGVANAAVDGDYSKIWDNEISNSLQDFNEGMERWLPNYKTQEEQERPWWQNMGTANFWADGVLKNLGFTVGAYYSGAAWTKGLKALGWMKKATSAQVVGSLLSGLNEGRIEANNGQREFLTLQNQMIEDAREKRATEIALDNSITDSEKIERLRALDVDTETERQDAIERAHKMGLTTLIGNTILLSADNMWQFGKLYSRGFSNAKGLSNRVIDRIERGAAKEGVEEVIENGVRKYVPKTTSKVAKAVRGLSNGLVEGNEEMAQSFIQSYAGHRQSYDSPDAYYEALTDPDARLQTKTFLSSLAEGFNDSYGSGDRWEEFAIGAFTGLLGMPTFGKVNNSDANTWLGKGRTVGISGGVFGEYRSATQTEAAAKEATDVMNKYAERLRTQAGYFAQSQSFTNAMDGFAAEDNKFEYKNAENNDDFAAISRFARTGRLNDLKEMVRQDFENMSDEQLADIAMNTTPNMILSGEGMVSPTDGAGNTLTGGWRASDGSLMSDTEEGREQMREALREKRDRILDEIDQYEKSVETVRAIGNNSLTEDQVNELAWLNWKTKILEDRYSSLKGYLEDKGLLSDIRWVINDYIHNIEDADPATLDDNAKEVKGHMMALGEYVRTLMESKTPMQLGQIVDANPAFQKALNSDLIEAVSGISHESFTELMNGLQDLAKLGSAVNQFNERYKEFTKNPINLIKNRQRIDQKKQKVAEAMDKENRRSNAKDSTVPDLVHADEIGDISLDEIEAEFADDAALQDKIRNAKDIRDDSSQLQSILQDDDSLDEQTLNDALKLLDDSKNIATDEEQLLDLGREIYNDANALYDPNDPTIRDIGTPEELQEFMTGRLDAAKTALSGAISKLLERHDSASEAQASPEPTPTETPEPEPAPEETGRDAVEKVEAINEKKEEAPDPVKTITDNLLADVESKGQIHDDIRDTYKNELQQLVQLTLTLKDNGLDLAQAYQVVQASSMWRTLAAMNSNIGPTYIQWLDSLYNNGQQSEAVSEGQEEVEIAYVPTTSEQESQVNALQTKQNEGSLGETLPETYKYWKPTITELPIHNEKNSTQPFFTIARTMKRADGSPMFTDQQLRRIEAVGEYLHRVGAFHAVNMGQGTQAGDKVGFRIIKSLNLKAGEPVILITNADGQVIGDIMSLNDRASANQVGLKAFVERVLSEYKEAGEPEFFDSKETSVIDKHMVGKVPFSTIRSTLNDMHGGSPFTLGIAMTNGPQAKMIMTPGRRKAQGQSNEDLNIIPALSAKAGQPFLLMPTGDKKGRKQFVPVPITIPKFGEIGENTMMFNAVANVVSRILVSDNKTAPKIISDLQELLCLDEVHINYSGDNVKVHIKTRNMEHQVLVYNGPKNENLTNSILMSLKSAGVPLNVSRKYMNTTYKGNNYNDMIGEVATTNLGYGSTHTVSDWFTIKPLDANGNTVKTSSPRNLGRNPNVIQSEFGKQEGQEQSKQEAGEVVRTLGAQFVKSVPSQPNSYYSQEQVADIRVNPNYKGFAGTNPNTLVITLSKASFTPQEVLDQLKGLSSSRFTEQKKAVLNKIITNSYPGEYSKHGWTMEMIEELLSDEKAATTFVIAHERSHQEHLKADRASELYDASVRMTEDGSNGWMSSRALDIETRATLDALNAVEAMKPVSITKRFANLYSGYFEGSGASIEHDYNIPVDDKAALQVISDFENASMSNQMTDAMARKFLEVLKKYNPTRYEADKEAFSKTGDRLSGSVDLSELENNANSTPSRPVEAPKTETPTDKMKKMGLLTNSLNREIWDALENEVQETIASKPLPIARQFMTRLSINYVNHKFTKPVSEILNLEKHREITSSQTSYDLKSEVKWLSKVLPQYSKEERLQLIDGLTKMDGSTEIYGKFKQGIIYLNVDNQTRGTTYHEAFHAVFNTLMTEEEVRDTYELARARWGHLEDIELEEKLAEDFREYVEYEQYGGTGVLGTLTKTWRKLQRLIRHLLGKDTALNRLYYDINKGAYASRNVNEAIDYNERYRAEDDNPQTFKAARKIQKAVNSLGGFNVGVTGITRLITKEKNRQFFVINRAAQINRSESYDGNYQDVHYHSNEVLQEVMRRLTAKGMENMVVFEKYGNTFRVKPQDQTAIEKVETSSYRPTLTGTEDDFLDIQDYHDDFNRLSPEEQMEAFNNGIQNAEQWDELTEAEKENFKACHF